MKSFLWVLFRMNDVENQTTKELAALLEKAVTHAEGNDSAELEKLSGGSLKSYRERILRRLAKLLRR